MAKFKFGVVMNLAPTKTVRLGDGGANTNRLTRADNEKLVKQIADSQYGLAAVGNEIEGVIVVADDIAPQDGFNLGSIQDVVGTRIPVTFDGLQATPGTGVIALLDYVVTGTPVARGTPLSAPVRVCKATADPFELVYKWRVVSLNGTGAVGQTGLIERVA